MIVENAIVALQISFPMRVLSSFVWNGKQTFAGADLNPQSLHSQTLPTSFWFDRTPTQTPPRQPRSNMFCQHKMDPEPNHYHLSISMSTSGFDSTCGACEWMFQEALRTSFLSGHRALQAFNSTVSHSVATVQIFVAIVAAKKVGFSCTLYDMYERLCHAQN